MATPGTDTEEVPAPPADGSGPPPVPTPASAPAPPPNRPRRLRALLIGCVIAAALAVFLFVGLGTSSNTGSGNGAGPVVGVGARAPDFSLPSITGGAPVRLDALGSARHRPVVLNFFASWCIPCQKETPLLARTAAAEQAKGSPVQFVGVDVAEQPSAGLAFVQKSGITYPVGADTDVRVTSSLYGLNAEPNTFFIDASGHVIGHVIGGVTAIELTQWLHRLAGAKG